MKVFNVGADNDLEIESKASGLPERGAFWIIRRGIAGAKKDLPIVAIYSDESGVRRFISWCANPWHGLYSLMFLASITVERVPYDTGEAAESIITGLAKEFVVH